MTTVTLNADRKAFSPAFVIGSIAFATLGTLVLMAMAALISGGARISYDSAPIALTIHVGTVVPALFLGGVIAVMRKGTRLHKILGRTWATLMMITAISSFWLQGLVGGIGPIHIFSVITLISIPRAIWAIRKGNVLVHKRAMMGPYLGLVVAGLFSFLPERLMGQIALALF